ncbi:MAG: class I SAM-dependent methyltransferase [Myxococcales bacterium]|nr:class I SAM-dependent methyltransferase [Myxococcales bacterium]
MAAADPASNRYAAAIRALDAAGACLTLVDGDLRIAVGAEPPRAELILKSAEGRAAMESVDHLRLAEAHLAGDIDVEGDLVEVLKVATHLRLDATRRERLWLAARLLFRDRVRYDRDSIAFHYDRPPEFFLPWLGRWRCYSHGLYAGPDDDLDAAMARKMQRAVDLLGLEPGMRVLDMGGGWGCFVEYAGRLGIEVHAITISEQQHRFVEDLIREQALPCRVELVNFREYEPARPFDAAVFMGTFEHNPEYARAAAFLSRHLTPGGRVWADFCAQRSDFTFGGFMKKYVWPGPIRYVNPYGLVEALIREDFNIHELRDDTLNYAWTIRDWGDRFEANRKALAEAFGEPTVRAFLLFLRGSWQWLRENQTQAYHLVAGLSPARPGGIHSPAGAGAGGPASGS